MTVIPVYLWGFAIIVLEIQCKGQWMTWLFTSTGRNRRRFVWIHVACIWGNALDVMEGVVSSIYNVMYIETTGGTPIHCITYLLS